LIKELKQGETLPMPDTDVEMMVSTAQRNNVFLTPLKH
jgi:hypothetical protein